MKKVKNDKNYSSVENQNILSILDASITKDTSNQKLLRSVTRGGLSAVDNQCTNIFFIAEKHFTNVTKKINLRKIPTDEIISYLLKNPDAISNYNSFSTQLKVPFQKKYLKMCWKKCQDFIYELDHFLMRRMLILRKYCNQERQIKRVLEQI